MHFILRLGFALTFLYETLSQTCRSKNTEYNLLTIVSGETFRLPLNEYFVGDGLKYSILPQGGAFKLNQPEIQQGTIQGTIISSTSSTFNNNPYIQGKYYYALAQTGNSDYTVYNLTLNTSSYNSSISNITSGTCYSINYLINMVVVTCSQQGTNYLEYLFYPESNPGDSKTTIIDTITITPGSYVMTQIAGQYIVTLMNAGTFQNGNYSVLSTNIAVFQFDESSSGSDTLSRINLPVILSNKSESITDFYTGVSINQNGILFVSTYYSGFMSINLQDVQASNQQFNPFSVGTLGISSFKLEYNNDLFYIAIWSSEGLIVAEFHDKVVDLAPAVYSRDIGYIQANFIESNQIPLTQMFTTQVFMNSRYIIVSNFNGISVYPSLLNSINDWKLLYYYNTSVQSAAFDYFNNIMLAVSGQIVTTYLFSNPTLTISNLPVNTTIQNITITASINMFEDIQNSACVSVMLYYNVTSSEYQQSIFNSFQTNTTKQTFVQWGPLFQLFLGSTQFVNINKMLIGPAILAGQPITQQAYSNFDIQFSNVLSTPQIDTPFRINSNLIGVQRILYSQLFYDAPFLQNYHYKGSLTDNYLQLVQVSNYVALFQCAALQNLPCYLIANIAVKDILVEQFALSISANNSLNVAFMWNEYDIKEKITIGKTRICMLDYPYEAFYQTCKTLNYNLNQTNSSKAIQIGLIQNNFFMLYSQPISDEQQKTKFSAFNLLQFLTEDTNVTDLQSFKTYPALDTITINSFSYNVPAYGNIIFLNTQNVVEGTHFYYVTSINYNAGLQISSTNQSYFISEIGTVQTYNSTTEIVSSLQLTIEGMYHLIINDLGQSTLTFYPRIELLPILLVYQYKQTIPNANLNGVKLYLYGVQKIVQTAASARFLYIMVQPSNSNTYQIYVYRNTPSIQNALYYVISSNVNVQIVNAPFSVASAAQYDGILFKSKGNEGYTNSLLLEEFEFAVQCNLNSNFLEQTEYSYIIFKASSLLQTAILQESAQEYWVTFQSVNLVSFVKEASTIADGLSISPQGYTQVDPREYFLGNIQNFQLTNGTNQSTYYYFDIASPVERQPQTQNYQFPVTGVSAYMYIENVSGGFSQPQYWFTFVQTNRLVYVTPYFYYKPPQDFVDNSTVKIDYPLIYKLPILDISPNSQNCPLIFVDAYSKGVVSVCGTNINNKFAASFTLFNPLTKEVQETKIIQLDEAFPTLKAQNQTNNGTYFLSSATYLDIGVVVLQFQYNYNFGSAPPTIIILPFLYTSNLFWRIASYPSNPSTNFFQFIQPIQSIYQVPNNTQANQYSVTVIQMTNEYFGGLNQNLTLNPVSQIMFGYICVSEIDELSHFKWNCNRSHSRKQFVFNIFFKCKCKCCASTNSLLPFTSYTNNLQLLNLVSDYTKNSVQKLIQAGSPIIQYNAISVIPVIAVSQGTAYVFNLEFQLANGEYLQSKYACTLLGLSNKNRILQISASSSNTGQYQVVAIVANPTSMINNQVTLLNYGFINQQCNINYTPQPNDPIIVKQGVEVIVTAIGSTTYISTESNPILSLMQPTSVANQPVTEVARTLISDNQVITLLDTSPYLTISAYPNYNLKGGVTLNSSGIISNVTEPLVTSISAISIQTYINNQQVSGKGGSTIFNFTIKDIPINPLFPDSVWDRKLWGQFIWGFFMFAIIVGVVGYLFYKSQPLPYERL
ncbi:unnamed protein product (macronuclear) [Paramecium tetraurelia]|uniref:Transmembrane protein n=1 Tax=Paramecium tetraurelia TaxID=5888 RepID=A0BKX2_PARTE|nr:uncharacterized protein GSPATT00029820001 [Paramecium tetraurelia]CAK59189.1 unnamed protein product [Paramecium tetraurelia]|eukprot:XP_001426587.1 hypothetical protein (macronuclear) [Paramecium tetraurelia strain d4-2]